MLGSDADFSGFFAEFGARGVASTRAGTVDRVPFIRVDDPADPRLVDYVGLTDPQLRRRVEAERGFFIAESPLVVRALIESGRVVRSVLVTPAQHGVLADVLDRLDHHGDDGDVPVYVAADEVLRQVVGFDLHRGAVAAAERWPLPPVGAVLEGARRIAVLERINDYENLGGLFRNAAAFGIDAVVLDTESADPLYRRCVRVSIGHAFRVPWARVTSPDEVRDRGFTLFALTPSADATPLDEIDWPGRHALMLGAEGPGLSQTWLDAADVRVRIPMRDSVDSLNVATAAAIAFYAST
jgi:tRNA G18 (ribose-2'-O)-methylase SpoU